MYQFILRCVILTNQAILWHLIGIEIVEVEGLRCTKQFVINVEENVKFHLNPLRVNLFFAVIVLKTKEVLSQEGFPPKADQPLAGKKDGLIHPGINLKP